MFSSISLQILVPLASAILAAAVALLGVHLTNLNNRRTEEDRFARNHKAEREIFKRQKLEELYLLFSKWDADLLQLGYLYHNAIRGEISEEKALLYAHNNKISGKDDLQRITMLLDLYFSQLRTDFDTVLDSRGKVLSFCEKPITLETPEEDLISIMDEFSASSWGFKGKMLELAAAL